MLASSSSIRGGLALQRGVSGWLGGILGRIRGRGPSPRKVEEQESSQCVSDDSSLLVPPEEVLEKIARDHLPDIGVGSSWREASLGDTQLKTKILSSFERTFQHSVPNRDLAGISTFTDLVRILATSTSQLTPRVFPNIQDDGNLPPNLSIQFINTAPRPKPNRKPFQNFDARRPEHATFLSKAQRERRKLKGRHLTAARYKP